MNQNMKTEKKYIKPAIVEVEIGNATLASVSSTGSSVDFGGETGTATDAGEAMVSKWTTPWDDTTTDTK